MKLTRAVTHIRLCAVNDAKVAALDALAAAYMALRQQYATSYCAETESDGYAAPCFPSPLSQRWQRVAIQQAAGIARVAMLSTGAIAQRSKRFAVGSVVGGCTPTTMQRSTSPHDTATMRSRLLKPDRSSRRSWRRATSSGGTKPVGRSPTAQLLVQRA